jgi:hypothetical protein
VLQLEVLVGELVSVDGLSTSSVVVGKVTACVNKGKEKIVSIAWIQTLPTNCAEAVVTLDIKQSNVPWHINPGMTRWKVDPENPNPFSEGERMKIFKKCERDAKYRECTHNNLITTHADALGSK